MISFDDREVELLLLALRFWRSQRRDGVMRRSDPFIAPRAVDQLIARLESKASSTLPPDDPTESLDELFPR